MQATADRIATATHSAKETRDECCRVSRGPRNVTTSPGHT